LHDPVEDPVTDEHEPLYRGRIVTLEVRTFELPNGVVGEFEIVRHPGGAAVVAVDAHGAVCLLRQYRPILARWLWELPAGKLDPGETPLATARRELAEEAGVTAADWEPLGRLLSSPGVFTEEIHLFLARGLAPIGQAAEAHELFEIHWLPFAEALAWARCGEITDAKTVAGLFRAEARLESRSPSS
jgi:ADP-ribose pyrophosphatase